MFGNISKEFFNYLNELCEVQQRMINNVSFMNAYDIVVQLCVECLNNQGKILIAGNGGSAADSQHFAGELVSRFNFERPALPAIALTTDTSVITAIGNDYGYENVFERQLQALGRKGDLFISISTSGQSKNIIKAIRQAKAQEMSTIGLTGETGGSMKALCDVCLCVPSTVTSHIQEAHLVIEHSLCAAIEKAIFGQENVQQM